MTDHPQEPSDSINLATQTLRTASQLDNNTTLVQRFKIIAPLGSGAQGNVYHAFDQLLEVDVAIKVVETSIEQPSQMDAIRNEVLIARQLQHPNIIRIFDVFEDQGLVFFTMEHIKGEALINRLEKPLSKIDFQTWTEQLFLALSACEAAQIKHGDIKPDNIIIDQNNDLRLIDFGIGQHHSDDGLQTSGHQDYSAPEVLYGGKSGIHSELFSAGKTIQLMLANVSFRKFSLADRWWVNKQLSFAASLCHPNQLKRPSLSQSNDFYHRFAATNWRQKTFWVLLLALAISLLLWIGWKATTPNSQDDMLPADTIQIAIVHDGKSGLLTGLVELLEMPLQTNPQLSVINGVELHQAAKNLALQPSVVPEDRVNLATLFALDAMIVLSINNIQADDFLIRASVYSMPADTSVMELTRSINANQLEQDLAEFAISLFTQLESKLSQQFEQSEATSLATGMAALAADKYTSGEVKILPSELTEHAPSYSGAWYQAAFDAWQQGDVELAQEHLSSLFALQGEKSFWRLKGRLLQAEMNDNLELAQQAIQKLTDGYPGRADLLAQRADIHEWANDKESAIKDYQQAVKLTPNNPQLWFKLARLKILSGDTQSAVENELTRALVIYRNNKDIAGEGLVLNAFGVSYLRLAEYDTAEKYLQDALALYDPKQYPLERVKALANLATVDGLNGKFIKAKEALEEALQLLEVEGDKARQAHVFDTLGFLHEEQGLYSQALNYYKRGLDIRSFQSGSIEQAQSMSNVAYMHFLIGDYSLADIYWQQAKTLFSRNNERIHLQRTLQNLAQLSLAKGDHLKATRYLTEVSQHLDGSQKQELMINKLLYSFLNFAEGALATALDNLSAAQQIAIQTEDKRALTESYLWHGEICLRIADLNCLETQITQADSSIAATMIEQHALLSWLKFSYNLETSELTASEPSDFIEKIQQANIPVFTEIKILLDLQERLALPIDSEIMQRLDSIVKPIFYQQHMNMLYLKSSQQEAKVALRSQLLSHPKYWRNHLYYQVFDEPKLQLKQQQLSKDWLQQLTEKQAELYKERYFDF